MWSFAGGAAVFFALYAAYTVIMAWNVTLDPKSPRWSIILKQACAVVTWIALLTLGGLGIQLQ